MKIKTKEDVRKAKKKFYEDYAKGLFGNKAKSWESYQELIESGWKDEVCIRGPGIRRENSPYNIPLRDLRKKIDELVKAGWSEKSLKFNQSMPDGYLALQGEVREFPNLHLTYSTLKVPMNQALRKEEKTAKDLSAKLILKNAMDPSSFNDLKELLDFYPSHTIEFSTYSINVGEIPGRNTVFWEVRDY